MKMEPVVQFDPTKVNERNTQLYGTEYYSNSVDSLFSKVNKLEQEVNAVEQYFKTADNNQTDNSKCGMKRKGARKNYLINFEKEYERALQREAAAEKRMQKLMNKFKDIFDQVTNHKWAWLFMKPVDAVGLGLDDYYKVIKKPMDLGTIKNKMKVEDGTAYKHVREIYADVRLVFKNAMTYNYEKSDPHVMAKTLLEKFEEKWLQLLPDIVDEEIRRREIKVTAAQMAEEVSLANMARNLNSELSDIDTQLKNLREMIVQKCRKTSFDEKRKLVAAIAQLGPDDLTKVLEIVADGNPSFQATAREVDLDINNQNELTLWRLRVFVKEALKVTNSNNMSKNAAAAANNNKRKILDANRNPTKKAKTSDNP